MSNLLNNINKNLINQYNKLNIIHYKYNFLYPQYIKIKFYIF